MKNKFKSEIAFLELIDFKSQVMDSIPGIVFLYEVLDNDVKLIKWNNFLSDFLGYSDQELLNKSITHFHSPKEIKRIQAALQDILKASKGTIETTVRSKSGNEYPVFVTGYTFQYENKTYLIGVGTLLTHQKEIEQRLKQARMAKRKEGEKKREIARELERKKRELLSGALQLSSNTQVINNTLKLINGLLQKHNEEEYCNGLKAIKKNLEILNKSDNWLLFKMQFEKIHRNFFKNLKKKNPSLTESEFKFCAYLYLHMSSTQIASALNISKEGIRKNRYRIRKKLGLNPTDSLEDYISKY